MQTQQKYLAKHGKSLMLALALAAGSAQAAMPSTPITPPGSEGLIAYAGKMGTYAFDTKPIGRMVAGRSELVFPHRRNTTGQVQQKGPAMQAGASSLGDPKWLLAVAILGFAFFSTGRRNRPL